MERFREVRGTKDLRPGEIERWHYLEKIVRTVMDRYGYLEIRTPMFESTELFSRSIGSDTDIVQKEMYTFPDRKGRSLTLRPEGTASVARSYLQHNMGRGKAVTKLYYMGPMFRYERPQKGRFRQFHQFGTEAIGSPAAWYDTETISVFYEILDAAGLGPLTVRLGSVGDPGCRPAYTSLLKEYLRARSDELCGNCKERMEKNPLRVLDCKNRSCGGAIESAPSLLDHLCEPCTAHLGEVRSTLEKGGIPFELDRSLVRGLDYYSRTVFEIHHDELGAQSALGGGGRYDGLLEDLGGPPTPGVGFSAGMERIITVAESLEIEWDGGDEPMIYVAPVEETAAGDVFPLVRRLRRRWKTEGVREVRNLKTVLKRASRAGAGIVLLLGAGGALTVKRMDTGDETGVSVDHLEEEVEDLRKAIAARRSEERDS